jgi:hypothetical protein
MITSDGGFLTKVHYSGKHKKVPSGNLSKSNQRGKEGKIQNSECRVQECDSGYNIPWKIIRLTPSGLCSDKLCQMAGFIIYDRIFR